MLLPAVVCCVVQPPVNSLAAVLERLYWNPSARGPLLVVAPECYTPHQKPDEPPPELFAKALSAFGDEGDEDAPDEKPEPLKLPAGPLNHTALLPLFGLQVTRLAGLSVVTHSRMQVPKPLSLTKEQVEDSGRLPTDTLERFLATLDKTQWQALGGPQGLAETQLSNPQQKKLFRQLLPSLTTVYFATEPPIPKWDPELSDAPPELPPGALGGMRLRIEKRLSLTAFLPGAPREGLGLRDQESQDPEGKLRRAVLLVPEKYISDDALSFWATRPARAKPTQLDPNGPALEAPIALEGARTVGELVARIARATRLPLLCDKRVAGRSVWIKGRGSVRSGTVLAALCRGVQGTVRRLDGLYLLTAELQTSLEQNEATLLSYGLLDTTPLDELGTQLREDARVARGSLIRTRAAERVPRDSRSEAPAALWTLGEKLPKPRSSNLFAPEDDTPPPDPEGVPLATLPAVFQQRVRDSFQKRLDAISVKPGESLPKQPTQVAARVNFYAELLLPRLNARARIGSIPLERIHPDTPLPETPPPVTWPETPVRAWYLPLPTEESESAALLTLATQCKVTELRIVLPPGAAAEKRLTELARRAKDAKLTLVPVLRPFVALSPETRRDVDLLGRTARAWSQTPLGKLDPPLDDYVAPEALDTALFVAYCQRLAQLPGVTGLALAELAPPGYGASSSWEGGGQRGERLAFLQKEGLDPADLQGEDESSAPEIQERWERRKVARREAALTRLYQALKAAALPVPISAEGGAGWERWRQGVLSTSTEDEESEEPPKIVAEARPTLLNLSLRRSFWFAAWSARSREDLLDQTGQLRAWLQKGLKEVRQEPHYDGVVLDLSQRPFAEGLALLTQAFKSGG